MLVLDNLASKIIVYVIVALPFAAFALYVLAIILLVAYLKKLDKFERSLKLKSVGIVFVSLLVLAKLSDILIIGLVVFYAIMFLFLLGIDIGLIVAIAATPKVKKQKEEVKAVAAQPQAVAPINVVINQAPAVAPTPIVVEKEFTSLAQIQAFAKTLSSFIISKRELGQAFKNAEPNSIVKLRAKYTKPANGKGKGLLLADTYSKKVKGKEVCFAYVYELDTKQVFLLLKIDNDCISEIAKTYPSLRPTKFPKPGTSYSWYRFMLDTNIVSDKQQVLNLLKVVYQSTK